MNNLHVLSTGVLVNDPLIEWAGSHISNSTLYKCFNMEWTIVTHSKERAEKAICPTNQRDWPTKAVHKKGRR